MTLPVIIGLAVIVLVVASRTRGTPLRAPKLIIMPTVVLVAGALAAAAAALLTQNAVVLRRAVAVRDPVSAGGPARTTWPVIANRCPAAGASRLIV
ncbi:MAG TPA: hypothetical protein VHY58_25045 [Streptosporangiaceae bacterium]|nr:hypothetical protein [Streptosporangiaceae bacterium]